MSFVKDMFREFEFAFCVSEVFPMFFESCVEDSVGSSYIKFVSSGACHFINPLPVIFVILSYLFYLYFPPSSHQIYACFCPVGLSLI